MNGAMTELADLGFLVDELQLEHDVARRAECARQVYLHAHRGADLSQHVARLLTVQSSDHMTMRQTGWALAAHAYRTADAELVRRLLTGPHRLALLQLDHRAAAAPARGSSVNPPSSSSSSSSKGRSSPLLCARTGQESGLARERRASAEGRDLGPAEKWALAERTRR